MVVLSADGRSRHGHVRFLEFRALSAPPPSTPSFVTFFDVPSLARRRRHRRRPTSNVRPDLRQRQRQAPAPDKERTAPHLSVNATHAHIPADAPLRWPLVRRCAHTSRHTSPRPKDQVPRATPSAFGKKNARTEVYSRACPRPDITFISQRNSTPNPARHPPFVLPPRPRRAELAVDRTTQYSN